MARGLLRELRAAFGGRPPAPVESAIPDEPAQPETPAVSEIIERLREFVVRHGDGVVLAETVKSGDRLFDCGHVDSMSGIALLTLVEDHYEVNIKDFELMETSTSLRALAQRIDESHPTPESPVP